MQDWIIPKRIPQPDIDTVMTSYDPSLRFVAVRLRVVRAYIHIEIFSGRGK